MAGAQVGLPGPFPEPPVGPCPMSDSDSDSEDTAAGGTGAGARAQNPSQVIHSGHFMVSSPHSDSLPRRRHHRTEPEAADPRSIDPTLTRLFECMSLEYSGKLVSPKWKNFKGLRLLCRDKIRLNNAIWRAWYIQYVERRKNPVCGFITPLEGSEADEHRKPEAVVLEGNYWKRRIEVVMREYHKWRIYYKKRLRKTTREEEVSSPKQDEDLWRPMEKWCNQLFCNVVPMLLGDEEEEPGGRQHFDLDTFLSDISDTLFTMTQTPSAHQALPEDAYVGNADMIQPDLAPLQPSLDDMEISAFPSSWWPWTASASLDPSVHPSAPCELRSHLHFLWQEETAVLAPHGHGVMQDKMLSGTRLGHSDVLGQEGDGPGGDVMGRLLPASSWLLPSRGPIRVRPFLGRGSVPTAGPLPPVPRCPK